MTSSKLDKAKFGNKPYNENREYVHIGKNKIQLVMRFGFQI